MKKIMLIFISLFICFSNALALSKFSIGEQVPNMYIERTTNTLSHNGAPFMLKRDDGKFVYCIDPFEQNVSSDYYQEYNNNSIFNLSDEQLDKINLIAYFGYGYSNHTDIKWYGVTQFLIWKTLGLKDIYFTDVYHGDRKDLYLNEIKEIESLVSSYYTLPSIANKNFNYTIDTDYILEDTNNILNNYEIESSDIDVRIEGNKLYISTKEKGNYKINFIRKSPIDRDYILYYLKNSQSLIYPGRVNDISFSIDINVSSGSVTINKKDKDGIDRTEAKIEGALYGIFKDGKLFKTTYIDKNGYGLIDDIPYGDYYLREISPGIGYKLDSSKYYFTLDYDNNSYVLDVDEFVMTGKLTIKKYYSDSVNKKLEDGAIFEIYNINDELVGTYETKNGLLSVYLDYGKYKVKQIKGKEGYSLSPDFIVYIQVEKTYTYELIDEIKNGNLIINKYYGDENSYILEDGALFDIYDSNNKLMGEYETKNGNININLNYGNYHIVQKSGKEGYELIKGFDVSIKDNKTYEYNLYNKKKKENIVNEDGETISNKQDALIVEVPNTYKYDYNKDIPKFIIIIGLIVSIIGIKKVTNH